MTLLLRFIHVLFPMLATNVRRCTTKSIYILSLVRYQTHAALHRGQTSLFHYALQPGVSSGHYVAERRSHVCFTRPRWPRMDIPLTLTSAVNDAFL
ncbi:hypothetical protein BKA63DRAFT_8498 [Paraphoma chrysanthemicola]|nr:hypothetical protein BKA63DRAFT_8498 [Paraphoma chrysanthemicola]